MTSVMMTTVVLKIAAVLMLVMSTPLTLILSSSTVQPPVSIVRPLSLRNNMNQGNKFYHRAEDLDDYGIWDPSPVFGGGGKAAPLPNSQEK